jgi:Starter unit:ACP transacylase in aflatoxin biosynthesis
MPSQDPDTFAILGPQITIWTQESLSNLQSALSLDARLKSLRDSLVQLPSLWPAIEKQLAPANYPGHESLVQLSEFVAGKKTLDESLLGNIHLAPLTVLDHMVGYVQLAKELNSGPDEILKLPAFRAAQGFCIGFLSASVISSSHSWPDFERNASNALRLAAYIGAIIDIENASHSGATGISARWKTEFDRTYLESSLDLFPGVSYSKPQVS